MISSRFGLEKLGFSLKPVEKNKNLFFLPEAHGRHALVGAPRM